MPAGMQGGESAGEPLLFVARNAGKFGGLPPAVNHGNHQKRLFVRCIGDEVLTNDAESQGSCAQVLPPAPCCEEAIITPRVR